MRHWKLEISQLTTLHAHLDFQQCLIFWSPELHWAYSDIRLHVVAYPGKQYTGLQLCHCFLCVALKLFSLSFVPLLTSNPGDATACKNDKSIVLWLTYIGYKQRYNRHFRSGTDLTSLPILFFFFFFILRRVATSSEKPKAALFQIGSWWNLAGLFV